MGRTLATFNMEIRNEEHRFRHFRACLNISDKYHFDALWAGVKNHAAALSFSAHPLPMETILMGMIFCQEKRKAGLEEALAAGKAKLDEMEGELARAV